MKRLSEISGVSLSFLSDLTKGKANPSLHVMQSIATALQTPLSDLLESTDLDPATLEELVDGNSPLLLPHGYERICAVLPAHQAYIVRRWREIAKKKLAGK